MKEKCDMCGSKIENGECECGTWKSTEEMKGDHINAAMEQFHEMKRFIMTSDTPHLGVAAVYFRGDYNDCLKVHDFIKQMKGRPHYED